MSNLYFTLSKRYINDSQILTSSETQMVQRRSPPSWGNTNHTDDAKEDDNGYCAVSRMCVCVDVRMPRLVDLQHAKPADHVHECGVYKQPVNHVHECYDSCGIPIKEESTHAITAHGDSLNGDM